MAMDKKRLFTIASRIVLVVGFIAFWEWTAVKRWYDPFFTSYPSEILKDLVTFAKSGDLWYHTSITLQEAFLGLFYGTTIGIIVGVLFSQFVMLGEIFTPILSAINGIPQLALAPVYVLWFGLGLTSKVFLVSLMVFFCVFFSTYNGIKNIKQNLVESAHILGASSLQTLWYVVLPTSMPWIFSGIRAGVGACMVGAIIGEYMGSTGGFGWMITYATSFFMLRRVMGCITILLLVGVLLNWSLSKIERYVLRWRVESKLAMNIDNK